MTIPARVRIGPVDYRVEQVRNLKEGKVALNGQVHNDLAVIQLRADRGPQAKQQTLWHEILHALAFQAQLDSLKLSDERAIDGLAWGLMQVLRDNPQLVRGAR